MKRLLFAVMLALPLAAQQRLASDFEIAQMEKQLARARGVNARLSGHLNLGDLRSARNEPALAQAEYRKVIDVAERERREAREASSLSRYAHATTYAALAQAKLGAAARAFELLEEAARYASDDADAWNVYASAMRVLGHPRKAAGAARNAVAIAAGDPNRALDLAVYQYTLASALLESGESGEAERLLIAIADALRSTKFASLQREVARAEAFEVYSSVRGDVAAYVSLLNRAQLQLASMYERRGERAKARAQYARVLEARSDDATALAGLARLAESDIERERRYAEAFDANPFAPALVRQYREHLAEHSPAAIDASTTGGQVRRALVQLSRGELRAARATIDGLLKKFPDNATLRALRAETDVTEPPALPGDRPRGDELRALLARFERLTPEQRVQLDQKIFTSVADFASATAADSQTILESGTIGGVPFRFSEPTVFAGTFSTRVQLRYRILGVTRAGDADALLLEPLGVEPAR